MNCQIRAIWPGEVLQISKLIGPIFDEFVAPHFSQKGIDEFSKVIRPRYMKERIKKGDTYLVAEKDELIGVIAIKNSNHISKFFVKKEFQRKGVGKKLLLSAIKLCRKKDKQIKEITVNSAPNSVEIYRLLGFDRMSKEQTRDGIRFTEMKLRLISPKIPQSIK